MNGPDLRCRFARFDFLAAPLPDGPFDFVFDRGCFHVFDEPEERARFAAHVVPALASGGLWLSLIGSTEGPARELGPAAPLGAGGRHGYGARTGNCGAALRRLSRP